MLRGRFRGISDDLLIVPFHPTRQTGRLALQQGLFVGPTDITKPFVENINVDGDALLKLTIEPDVRPLAIEDLRYMNVTEASLFPGLDGFARSLRTLTIRPTPLHQALRNLANRPHGIVDPGPVSAEGESPPPRSQKPSG
jgi:hypothetical protein